MRVWVIVCVAAVMLIVSARVLGEQRPRDWIAFLVAPVLDRSLYVVDVALNFRLNVSQISDPTCSESHPTWSHDGRLAFIRHCDDTVDITIVDFVSGQISHFAENASFVLYGSPSWSSDGQIVFVVQESRYVNQSEVRVGDPRSGWINVVHRTPASTEPQWSNDGRLAFAAPMSLGNLNTKILFIRDVDGTVNRVTPPLSGLDLIGWSMDGARLAYAYGRRQGGAFIDVLDVSAGDVIAVVPFDGSLNPIGWSPDGRLTLTDQSSGSREIVAIDLRSGEKAQLTNGTQIFENFPQWSSDGQLTFLAYNRDGRLGVYINQANGQPVQVSGHLEVIAFPPVRTR